MNKNKKNVVFLFFLEAYYTNLRGKNMIRILIIMSLLISQNTFASSFEMDFVKSAIERTNFNVIMMVHIILLITQMEMFHKT
jgi:hypothetical protein